MQISWAALGEVAGPRKEVMRRPSQPKTAKAGEGPGTETGTASVQGVVNAALMQEKQLHSLISLILSLKYFHSKKRVHYKVQVKRRAERRNEPARQPYRELQSLPNQRIPSSRWPSLLLCSQWLRRKSPNWLACRGQVSISLIKKRVKTRQTIRSCLVRRKKRFWSRTLDAMKTTKVLVSMKWQTRMISSCRTYLPNQTPTKDKAVIRQKSRN